MVYSVLEFNLETEDRLLQRLAYQVAGVMLSSGNMKKNTKTDEVVDSIYAPIIQKEEPSQKKPERKDLNQDEAKQFIENLNKRINR